MDINNQGRIRFTDTPLPNGSIERVYSNGVREQRLVQGPGIIAWSDNRGNQGRDLYLGAGRLRREDVKGTVSEGQQVGSGITTWNGGQYVTVNETLLPELPLPMPPPPPTGFTGIVAGMGLGGLVGVSAAASLDPNTGEYALYMEEQARQEALRRQQQGTGDDGYYGNDFGFYYYGYYGGYSGDSGDFGSGTDGFG